MPEDRVYVPLPRWGSALKAMGKNDQTAIQEFEQEYGAILPFNGSTDELKRLVIGNKHLDGMEEFTNKNNGRIILIVPDGELSLEQWWDSAKRRGRSQSVKEFWTMVAIVAIIMALSFIIILLGKIFLQGGAI